MQSGEGEVKRCCHWEETSRRISSSIQRPAHAHPIRYGLPFSSASTSSTSHVFSNSILTATSPSAAAASHLDQPPDRHHFGRAISFGPAACSRHLLQAFCPLRGRRRCRRSMWSCLGTHRYDYAAAAFGGGAGAEGCCGEGERSREGEGEKKEEREGFWEEGGGWKDGNGREEWVWNEEERTSACSTNSSADSMNITSLPVCASSDVTVVSPSSPFQLQVHPILPEPPSPRSPKMPQ